MILDDNYMTTLLEAFTNSDTTQCATYQCYLNQTTPETSNWKNTYDNDLDTTLILSKLLDSEHTNWSDEDLAKVNSVYQLSLRDNRIQVMNKTLVLFKPILTNQWHVMIIIVRTSLRWKFFIHYHAGPSGGHMVEYKSLYGVWLPFFWSRLRENIKEWVKHCGHCICI